MKYGKNSKYRKKYGYKEKKLSSVLSLIEY